MTLLYETVDHPSENNDIREYLGLNLKMLLSVGMEFNLNNDRPIEKSKFMQRLSNFITNAVRITFVALQVNLISFVLRNHEAYLVIQICCELFLNIICIGKVYYAMIKSLCMATATERIQAAFDELSIFWAKYRPNQHYKMEIIEKARRTLNFSRCYLGIMITGMAGFALPPISNFVYHYFIQDANNYTLAYSKRIFLLKYPFEINNLPVFFFVLTGEGYALFLSAMYWVTCDTLFAQITTHASIQFKILCYDIGTLINHDRSKANVIIIIKRHQCLLRLVEDIFSPIIFITVVMSALNICVNIFETKAMNTEGNYTRAAFYANLVLVLFFQILFYCSFAETLTNQTSAIAESVYNCKWTEKNHKLGFYLRMIIMKSQSPFYCTAYGFFPIGHARMASIISTSFSYLMMLQSIN